MVLERQMESGRRAKPDTAEVGWWPFAVDMNLKSEKNTHCHSNTPGTLLVVEMGKDVGDWSHSWAWGCWVVSASCFSFISPNHPGAIVKVVPADSLFLNSTYWRHRVLFLQQHLTVSVTLDLGHVWKSSVKPLTLLLKIILSILNSLHFRYDQSVRLD